jgi:hypothetical protein
LAGARLGCGVGQALHSEIVDDEERDGAKS